MYEVPCAFRSFFPIVCFTFHSEDIRHYASKSSKKGANAKVCWPRIFCGRDGKLARNARKTSVSISTYTSWQHIQCCMCVCHIFIKVLTYLLTYLLTTDFPDQITNHAIHVLSRFKIKLYCYVYTPCNLLYFFSLGFRIQRWYLLKILQPFGTLSPDPLPRLYTWTPPVTFVPQTP